jgi:hypothetical protein
MHDERKFVHHRQWIVQGQSRNFCTNVVSGDRTPTPNFSELWRGPLPAGGQATPMTYVWKDRQYVVIAAGGHAKSNTKRGDEVVAFALGK